MADDFDMLFSNEVLKPQHIIDPMKPEQDDIAEEWGELYGVNTTKEMFKITTENMGDTMTVFVEGWLERINPLIYIGSVDDVKIIIEENDEKLKIKVPLKINGFVLKYKIMDGEEEYISGDFDQDVVLEYPIEGCRGAFPFSLTLFYFLA